MLTDLATRIPENADRNNSGHSALAVARPIPRRLSKRARGRVCLRKARKAVRETCTSLGAEAREELVSALMPALWRRVRNWRPVDKSFTEFAEQSAFQSLKDYLRARHSSTDALDREPVGLEELGASV
jgi:hypothetical protein